MIPDIFSYIDYREYLTDWYKAKKEAEPGFTHTYICDVLQLNTRSYFTDVIAGRRSIGPKLFKRLAKLLELKPNEQKYFEAIIGYYKTKENADKSGERESWFDQIVQLNNTPKKLIDEKNYHAATKWYYLTIRAYLETCDFNGDYAAVSEALYNRVSPDKVKEAIDVLKDLRMIAPDKNGFLKPVGKILTTGDETKEDIKDELIRQYQISNNEVLHTILQEDEPNTHETTLLTIGVSDIGMQRILGKIKQLRKEIMSIVHKDEEKAERVFKLALHAYPESRKIAP